MDTKLKKGIVAVLIANSINVFFSLATNFLLPAYLSVESYAGIKTFQLYVSYVGLLHFGYVDGMYLKYGGRELEGNIEKEFSTNISTMRIFQIFITACVFIIAVISKDWILFFLTISILPLNMNNYFKYLYQATGEFKSYGRIINVTTMATFAINILLLFVVKSDTYIFYIASYVLLYILIWIILEINFKRTHKINNGKVFSFTELLTNIKDGFILTLGNLASMLLTSMDRWFVKLLMNVFDFAQYSFAVSVENFLNLAITPITTTLYNYFCRETSIESHKQIYNYIVVFASIIPAAAFPVKLILEIYLTQYMEASRVVFILFAAQMFYAIIKSIYVNLYKVQRKQKKYFSKLIFIIVIGFIFNGICFNIIKNKEAFAIGTLLSAIVWFIITSYDFKYLKIPFSTILYLFCELLIFLMFGLNFSAITGCVAYILITILMLYIFMRNTLREICKKCIIVLKSLDHRS